MKSFAGADIHDCDKNGNTALHVCVRNGAVHNNVQCVINILQCGANVIVFWSNSNLFQTEANRYVIFLRADTFIYLEFSKNVFLIKTTVSHIVSKTACMNCSSFQQHRQLLFAIRQRKFEDFSKTWPNFNFFDDMPENLPKTC